MPLVLRTLFVLLLLDLAVGIWMRLHAERWLSFFVTHLPVLGLAGVAWGIAPDGAKSWLRESAQRRLEHGGTRAALLVFAVLLGAASLVSSSVRVESVDPGVRTRLRFVAGERTLDGSGDVRALRAEPLNRLTTPVTHRVWLPPSGRRVWVHAPGMATTDRRVLPWIPTRFLYPDDFDTLSTLAALPMPSLLVHVLDTLEAPELTIGYAADTAARLASARITTMLPVLFGFPEPVAPDTVTIGSWRDRLRGYFTDTTQALDELAERTREEEVASRLRDWREMQRRLSARPVVVGDSLWWALRRPDGTLLDSGTTRVTRAFTSIFLEP